MTDEAKELVERLRWGAWYYEDPFDGKAYASDDPLEAADLIETQAREIERLREALGKIARETTKVIPELINQQMCIDAVNAHARAALAGDSHV